MGFIEAEHQFEQGRFAGAVLADDENDMLVWNRQVDRSYRKRRASVL
jgi:hypothetical protein